MRQGQCQPEPLHLAKLLASPSPLIVAISEPRAHQQPIKPSCILGSIVDIRCGTHGENTVGADSGMPTEPRLTITPRPTAGISRDISDALYFALGNL